MSATIPVAVAERKIEGILDFLERDQAPDGEFSALRYFHGDMDSGTRPSAYAGWYHFGKCPFFTATILYHLTGFDTARAATIRNRACEWLLGTCERGVVRYVPARYQEVWFPTDIDDTCLVRKALRDNGVALPGDDRMILLNRDRTGRFHTWFVPRWRGLQHPVDFLWLVNDFRQWGWRLFEKNRRNALRLFSEYWSTQEPAIDANVLLYFGNDARVQPLAGRLVESLCGGTVRLENYDSAISPYFHAARAFHDGTKSLGVLRPRLYREVAERQDDTGCVQTGFDTAMAALALMYLDYWDSDSLIRAIRYLLADPMHERGWLPYAYAGNSNYVQAQTRIRSRRLSSRRRQSQPSLTTFSDGSAALTAVLYADALRLFVAHARDAA